MRRVLIVSLVALACCTLQQVAVIAVAQERPRVASENAGHTDVTKSGMAGGVWSPALTGERHPLYRLHKSDVLDITFSFSPEFDQTLSVQPDGFISMRGIQALYAEGQTVPELQEAIRRAYAVTLHDPEVNVVLKEFEKPYFVATGQITHPGKYELRGDTTVTEALAIAGGFTGEAKPSQVVLFRRVTPSLLESRLFDIKHMMKSRDLNEDAYLKPGDLLFVPQSTMAKLRRFIPTSNLSMYLNPTQF